MADFPLSFDEYGFWIDDEGTIIPVVSYQGHEDLAHDCSHSSSYEQGWIRGYLYLKDRFPMPSATFSENVSSKALGSLEQILKRIPAEEIAICILDDSFGQKHYHTDKVERAFSFIKSVML